MALALTAVAKTNGTARNGSAGLRDLEIALLLEGVNRLTGMEFRGYAPTLLKRRIAERVRAEDCNTIAGLLERVLHDSEALERFVYGLTVHPTGFFKDPAFYAAIRARVVPHLRTYPFVRIWHVGCGTGEETYTLATLLREGGIYERCKIYATDVSQSAIRAARQGRFNSEALDAMGDAYKESGGTEALEAYYNVEGGSGTFAPELGKNVIFAQHNVASEGSFNEFHLIVARNLLSNYNMTLQSNVHSLFLESLVRLGFLALGSKETIKHSPHERAYEEVDAQERIFRRVR